MHMLTKRSSGFVEMAYVGETPWHKLGQLVTKGASKEVWRKEAGLDWEALTAPVEYKNQDGLLLPFTGRKIIYRSDNSQPLGDVADSYQLVQPGEVLGFFDDMAASGGWHIHTAGSLKGGRIVWAMASCDYQGFVKSSWDKVAPNLLIATSLDGSMRTTAKLTMVRAVCWNTVSAALNGAGQQVQVSHRSYFDPQEIKESLGVSVEAFREWLVASEAMSETPIKLEEARDLLRGLFGQPKLRDLNPNSDDIAFQRLMAQIGKTDEQKEVEQRSVDRCLKLFQGEGIASSMPGVAGTRWGLLNAITQHIDHERGRTDDTRMEGAWFGKGEIVKAAAFELLAEAA